MTDKKIPAELVDRLIQSIDNPLTMLRILEEWGNSNNTDPSILIELHDHIVGFNRSSYISDDLKESAKNDLINYLNDNRADKCTPVLVLPEESRSIYNDSPASLWVTLYYDGSLFIKKGIYDDSIALDKKQTLALFNLLTGNPQ